ncbi:hypothetical protein [uncultured Roseobacter sp.]|uniref:hypothetical protein n=1 Tax=uncultured Roseobacter sp. TaxID=114847 RepID=UPI002601F264|nr:hypothetical protein [uncultured Roseobacter sp.]
MISADLVGCTSAFNKGTGSNRKNIRRDRLDERVLSAKRHHLMEPAFFKEFCDEFTSEMNRLRIDSRAAIAAAEDEVKRINRELDRLAVLILKGGAADRIDEMMVGIEQQKKELEVTLAEAVEPSPLLHPEIAGYYRAQVTKLHTYLQDEAEANRLEATEILRSLIDKIILTPTDNEMLIDVRGDLAGILAVSLKRKKPTTGAG